MQIIEQWLEQSAEHVQQKGRPLVTVSYAQSLDGSITAKRGQPLALSGAASSRFTHQLRSLHDAILVGVETVLADDPLLTVRHVPGKHPQPVILDSHLRTPLNARLVAQHPGQVWIAATQTAEPERILRLQGAGARVILLPTDPQNRVSLNNLLQSLASQGIRSLMVEGGAQVITSFYQQSLADQVVLTLAPVFVGGLPAVTPQQPLGENAEQLPRLTESGSHWLGEDLIVWGKLRYS